jgi:hypothetical protein
VIVRCGNVLRLCLVRLIVIASLLALWTILKGRKSFHPADKVIIRLSKKLTQRGLAREQGEGVMAYLQRLEQHQPHWQVVLQQLQTQYSVVRYQQPNHDVVCASTCANAAFITKLA